MRASVCARATRLITVLVLLGTSCLLAAGTGWAGGPTSALLVAPGYERAAALYYSDPEYQQLDALLADPGAAAGPAVLPTAGSGYITVTWLIHDVSIWRIDRVYLANDGDHLIVTQLMDGQSDSADGMYPGQSGNDAAIMHRSTDPAALQSLLDGLGLTAPAQRASSEFAVPAASNPTAVTASIAEPAGPAVGAWWILAGLLLGAGATAATVRYLPAVGRRLVRESGTAGDEPVQMTRLPV